MYAPRCKELPFVKTSSRANQRDVASFVLRFTQDIFADPSGDPRVQWRGHIRHVQSDEEFHFTELAEALHFLRKSLTQLTLDSSPQDDKPRQEKIMRESFKLWDDFAKSYSEMLVQAVEQTVKQTVQQTEALNKQMSDSIGQAPLLAQTPFAWWMNAAAPFARSEPRAEAEAEGLSPSDQERLIQLMLTMQAQMERMAAKLSTVERTVELLQQEVLHK